MFLVTLNWLVAALGHMNRPERQKTIVSYDNMCHLDNLKVAKKPLPLPGNPTFIVHITLSGLSHF